MNNYIRLNHLKADGGITGTSKDADLLRLITRVSRAFDDVCERHFYSRVDTKYYDGNGGTVIPIDDLISATTVVDDGTTLVSSTDYWLGPDNRLPNTPARTLELNPDSTTKTIFSNGRRKVSIAGLWGYSNETEASGLTGTVATTNGTTITASADASALIFAGDTLLIEDEQVYVTAVSTTSITVQRAINGTTAATHSAKALNIRRYPRALEEAVTLQSVRLWRMQQTGGAEGFGADSGMTFSTLYPVIRDLILPMSSSPVVVY